MRVVRTRHHGRRVVAALLFLAGILLLVTLAPVMLERRSFRLGERIFFETQPLHETAERVSRDTYALQSNERGYLLTGNQRYVDGYQTAAQDLEGTLDEAAHAASPEQMVLLAQVRDAVRDWRERVGDPRMALAEHGQASSALAAEARDPGEAPFQALQGAVAALSEHAQTQLDAQASQRRKLAQLVEFSAIALGVAGLVGLGVLAYALISARRLQVEAEHAHEQARLKDEFLSLVGHEIRTPVTVIRLVADAIRRHHRDGESQDEWLHDRLLTLQRQAQRIGWLIDELLDVGSVPGGIELRRRRTDAVSLTRRAMETVQASAPSYPLEFHCDLRRAEADLDESRVEQVLAHLVGNAVKFSLRPRPVRVELRVADDSLEWTIADQGSGIPREEQPRLFQRFYRGSNAPPSGGIGLGLHLTRVIVMAHGGRVWFESAAGRGTTFHVKLPRYLAEATRMRARPSVTPQESPSTMAH